MPFCTVSTQKDTIPTFMNGVSQHPKQSRIHQIFFATISYRCT